MSCWPSLLVAKTLPFSGRVLVGWTLSPFKATEHGSTRWQTEGMRQVLGCFLGVSDPSASDLGQQDNGCATVCLWRLVCGWLCVMLGFALAGNTVTQLKKEAKDSFRKLLLQGVQFMSFQR